MSATLSERLRDRCAAVWNSLPAHPFVCELATGTLPREKFRFYLEQNLLYLPEYARAIALGAARSGDDRQLRSFTASLTNVVETEIPTNRELLDRVIAAGAADRGGARTMAPATLAYTAYLTACAYRGGPLEVMTVILPCAWSYGEIARALRARDAGDPVYSRWLGFFGSKDYAALVQRMRGEFDELAATTDHDEARLAETFRNGARLELGFWQMAYDCEQWPDSTRLARRHRALNI